MFGSVTRQNVCQRRGAERGRRLFLARADLLEHVRHLAQRERQRHEQRGDEQPGKREQHLHAERRERRRQQAVAPDQQHEREADHHRRDRQRQIGQRVDQACGRESAGA